MGFWKKQEPVLFGEDGRFSGKLDFEGAVRIDGVFTGQIRGDELILGPASRVEATVDVKILIVFGQLTGTIAASERCELREGATHASGPRTVTEPGSTT